MSNEHILITGATGSTGRETIRALQQRGEHHVTALVHREDARSEQLQQWGADIVLGDLRDIDSVHSALQGVTTAYFCYPIIPGILDATSYFAQAATEAGVSAVVNMSQGTARRGSTSHASRDHWIAQQIWDWSPIPVTHLRPNLFAEWLLYPFTLWPLISEDVLNLPFGDATFAPLTAYDQGRVIAHLLTDPQPHAGKTYQLDGPETLDGNDIAAALTDALGRPIQYSPITIEAFQGIVTPIPVLGPFFAQHMGGVVEDLLTGLWSARSSAVSDISGTPPISLREFVRQHRNSFAAKNPAPA